MLVMVIVMLVENGGYLVVLESDFELDGVDSLEESIDGEVVDSVVEMGESVGLVGMESGEMLLNDVSVGGGDEVEDVSGSLY